MGRTHILKTRYADKIFIGESHRITHELHKKDCNRLLQLIVRKWFHRM